MRIPMQSDNFPSAAALHQFILDKQKGALVVAHRNVTAYSGMVQYIGLHFDVPKQQFDLDLEWISFGLDAFGENLLESYLYRFGSLEKVLTYLEEEFGIAPSDISMNYKIDETQFPNPFKDAAKKAEFEAAWARFQEDFAKGMFLDGKLELVG